MKWRPVSAVVSMVQREDRALMLYVSQGEGILWQVGAFETPAPDLKGSAAAAIQTAFDDHSHAQLDPVPTLEDALALAEKYARWWKGSRASHFVCGCDEIKAAEE
jgi:hypothetical protein